MKISHQFRIADLQQYVMSTSDKSWGKTATEFITKKNAFLNFLASHKKNNETEFIESTIVSGAIYNIFLDTKKVCDPNWPSSKITRTRASWAFVNIECSCTQSFSI